MKYRIEKLDAFAVIGNSINETINYNEAEKKILSFQKQKTEDGTLTEIIEKTTSMGILGITYNIDMSTQKLNYILGVEGEKRSKKLNKTIKFPAHTWAIFPFRGKSDYIKSVSAYINSIWLPSSKYIKAEDVELLAHLTIDYTTKEYDFEMWIPVKNKKD